MGENINVIWNRFEFSSFNKYWVRVVHIGLLPKQKQAKAFIFKFSKISPDMSRKSRPPRCNPSGLWHFWSLGSSKSITNQFGYRRLCQFSFTSIVVVSCRVFLSPHDLSFDDFAFEFPEISRHSSNPFCFAPIICPQMIHFGGLGEPTSEKSKRLAFGPCRTESKGTNPAVI